MYVPVKLPVYLFTQFFTERNFFLRVFSCGHATLWEALSVRRSVGPSVTLELSCSSWKREKRVFMMLQLVLFVCNCNGGGLGVWLGWGWGLDTPTHPSATILWPRVTCYFVATFSHSSTFPLKLSSASSSYRLRLFCALLPLPSHIKAAALPHKLWAIMLLHTRVTVTAHPTATN